VPARLARVLFLVVLLAGWQAALQHPIEHVDELGAFVHLHDGHSPDQGSDAGLLCDALAALTACAPDALVFSGTCSPDHAVQSHPTGAPRMAEAPPFLSQGPPVS
jgi:hypothetical protein